jgi:ankyrin repeat protein
MKILIYTNWSLIALYGILLLVGTLTLNQPSTDAAGRAMGTGFIVFGFILLGLVIGANCLPFQLTRIIVFIVLLLPLGLGIYHVLIQFNGERQASNDDAGRSNGDYYFHDGLRQKLALAIVNRDLQTFETLLQKPIPVLNESGEEHITLLDFAAMRGTYSDDPVYVLPFLIQLLKKGATIETADSFHTPTHVLVSRECSAAMLELFLKHGANPNARRREEQPTPILFTVMEYDYERVAKVNLLLDYGADPNAVYPPTATGWLAGHSALLAAARLEAWDVCQLLLEKGADPTIEGPQNQVFTNLLIHRAKLYAEYQNAPATFTSLLNVMKLSTPKSDTDKT